MPDVFDRFNNNKRNSWLDSLLQKIETGKKPPPPPRTAYDDLLDEEYRTEESQQHLPKEYSGTGKEPTLDLEQAMDAGGGLSPSPIAEQTPGGSDGSQDAQIHQFQHDHTGEEDDSMGEDDILYRGDENGERNGPQNPPAGDISSGILEEALKYVDYAGNGAIHEASPSLHYGSVCPVLIFVRITETRSNIRMPKMTNMTRSAPIAITITEWESKWMARTGLDVTSVLRLCTLGALMKRRILDQ